MKKNILLIGAGAVGLVYGKHFADGGHQVTFYIREKYVEEMSNGSILYHINKDKKKQKPIHFKNYKTITSFEEMGQQKWDEIYFCLSSTGLRSFDLKSMQTNLVDEPTIVMLQPSNEDFDYLATVFAKDQIVVGMITLISYAAPLTTEKVPEPGVAYYLPPMAPMPISGEKIRRDGVIQTYKSGKISASKTKNASNKALFPSAFLTTFLTALEASDWNFKSLRKNTTLLKEMKASGLEVFSALEKEHRQKRPFGINLGLQPWLLKILLRVANPVMPMDLETYFAYHFTKVKDQTKLYMRTYEAAAKKNGVPYHHLSKFNLLT